MGLGGFYAEVLADVCHALAPVVEATALSMLGGLRSTAALESGPPLVFDAIKETAREAEGAGFHQVMERVTSCEWRTVANLYGSVDNLEGFRAFAEKRPPHWTGR